MFRRMNDTPQELTGDIHAAAYLLERNGYEAGATRLLHGDQDLLAAITAPEYIAWLEAGAPDNGASTERVEAIRKGWAHITK